MDVLQGVVSGHLRVRDGTRIAYSVHGNVESGQRVLLVHSLGMDHDFWRPVVASLAQRALVMTVDARGHGASDKPRGPYRVEQMAQDMHDVVSAFRFDNVLVAGASMGGCVALQFAATWPRLTRAVGLIDTTAWYGEAAPQNWEQRAVKAEQGGLGPLVDFQTTRWFSDAFRAAHPNIVQRCVDTFLRNDVHAFASTCRMLGAFDGRALLSNVRAPCAVIVGEEDYAAPPDMSRALHAGIERSTLTVIPGARHLTPLETPDIVIAELDKLLDATER
ncbi:3-oxoadipate enol-lactonase [Paraburkholderia steynii]|uniref:3-oxoadipate enol-lactonase n=2 Tax=Paraburkholderia TaxID=1822464 RepID=A0A7Z7FIM2_9BURK|nr:MULTISPECIES: alpha/beta fold hydrolase [Paraburkholderia]BCZ82803.1 lactone hydrolase [Paraburkholderia terrae]SDH86903.1 3-oxoadipate enol-lactonase [Paraburkholderia steynii]